MPTSRPLLFLFALALSALSAAAAEPRVSFRAAAQHHLAQAANDGLRPAYLANIADDGIIMFLHARGRTEVEAAVGTRLAADAKFFAEPLVMTESASHDIGYVWGKYRLEFTRKSTGQRVVTTGKFVNVWKNQGSAGWRLFLDNWAGDPASPVAPAAAPTAARTGAPLAATTLREAEAHFLHQAATDNMRAAFLAHMADDGTIMFLSAKGRAEIEQAVRSIPADARILAEPQVFAEAAAGDLGYVWGAYRFEATVEDKPFSATGKFITVWQRQPNGEWRIALDHGAQDPAPPPAPAAPVPPAQP